MKNEDSKFPLLLDFDGTITTFEYPFEDPSVIKDPLQKDVKESIEKLKKYFKIIIFSVRASSKPGEKAIREYLTKNEIHFDKITAVKEPGLLVDDNCITHNGSWPETLKKIANFTHWKDKKNDDQGKKPN